MILIGLKRFLLLNEIKNSVPWAYVISDLNGEEIIGSFYEKELQKTNQKTLRIEKVIKKKGKKLKWKGYKFVYNIYIYIYIYIYICIYIYIFNIYIYI